MLGTTNRDRRSERRAATRREILDAAWELVRADGLASLSLRDLAKRVGMQAPSLYGYFESKAAIYDAMFREGFEAMLGRYEALEPTRDHEADLLTAARTFASFCVEDPARYLLMFQRTIPGFEPSPDSYGPAVQVLAIAQDRLARVGITDAEALDLWTALLTGLVDQQISNDPGGDRWLRLLPDALHMYLQHHGRKA